MKTFVPGPEVHPWADREAWQGHGVLQLQRPGEMHAVWVFWSGPDRTFSYWYVNLFPYPDPSCLEPLQDGRWHTGGWTGAVLPYSAGPERAAAFIREAVARCRALLS